MTRHSAATWTIPVKLGHSDVVITLNLYSHVLPNVQEAAAERFGEAWRERSPDGGTSG